MYDFFLSFGFFVSFIEMLSVLLLFCLFKIDGDGVLFWFVGRVDVLFLVFLFEMLVGLINCDNL